MKITSGTLSYAVGVGKPVISTPYAHATEILADGHGVLVDFRDSAGFAREINRLLDSEEARTELSARAYARGRTMISQKQRSILQSAARSRNCVRSVANASSAPR